MVHLLHRLYGVDAPDWRICSAWLNARLNECAGVCTQSDREKEEGLPVAPFMDREKVTKPTAQIGFIKFVLLPMFETIAKASVFRRLITARR